MRSWMVPITCHAGMPATALARFIVGSHHHASGGRVTLIHPAAVGARRLVHADVDELQPVAVGLQPEVEGVLLRGRRMIVKD